MEDLKAGGLKVLTHISFSTLLSFCGIEALVVVMMKVMEVVTMMGW